LGGADARSAAGGGHEDRYSSIRGDALTLLLQTSFAALRGEQ
jgi:hypothetical protein